MSIPPVRVGSRRSHGYCSPLAAGVTFGIMRQRRPTEPNRGGTHVKRLVACGATALLILAAAHAPAQKDKDGGKQPPRDKDKPAEKDGKPKDKDKDKTAPKVEEPKAAVALRAIGGVIERDKGVIVGVNLFGTKAGDTDLAHVA